MDSRAGTAAIGLVASLAVSVAAWYYFDTLLVFLVLPFVPILFRSSDREGSEPTPTAPDRVRQCPRCGFRTRDEEYAYCPRDGTRLDARE